MLEESREDTPDPPYSLILVRDALFNFERVHDWMKDVHQGYLGLARWKKPYHTGLFLALVLACTWTCSLVHLLLVFGTLYIIRQLFKERIATSDKTEFSFSRMFSLRNLVFGRHMLRVDDIPRMMKLNMRVSATFQEIWTVFFKTQSLLTWEDPGATSGLVLALLGLIGLATWKGQAFVVQFAVTAVLLKLFVADHVLYLFPEAAKYDPIGRAWDRLPVHPVEDS